MVTEEQIAQLDEFNGGDAAVLSLYLDLDPEREPARAHRVVLDDLTREIGERLEPPACRALEDEATWVRAGWTTRSHGAGAWRSSRASRAASGRPTSSLRASRATPPSSPFRTWPH
jgi:hypothetical protein